MRCKSYHSILDVPKEQLLSDAYYGVGGFEDGTYLVPHARETSSKYDRRREVSYFLNYLQSIVNSHVDPVFNKAISRDWEGSSTLFDIFMDNVDNNGSKMNDFMKIAGLSAKLKGSSAIVCDNFPAEQQPQSVKGVIENRTMPYLFIVEREDIISYKLDRFGKVVQFAYREPMETTSTATGETNKTRTVTWTNEKILIVEEAAANPQELDNSLGYVPVTILTSRKVKRGQVFPPSEFYSIAKANLRLFNMCSELDEILRNQAFSILIYPGQNNGNARTVARATSDGQVQPANKTPISVGTDNILGFPSDCSNPPAFIAPPAEPSTMIMDQIDRLVQEMYRMAVLSFVTGVQEQSSGLAKQWDYQKTNQVLADFADNCEKCERDIARFFNDWTKSSIDYTPKYPDDFGISDVAEALTEAQQALDLAIGGRFNVETKKKAASIYFADLNEDDYDAVMKDIEDLQEAEDKANEEAAASLKEANDAATAQATNPNSAGTEGAGKTTTDVVAGVG